MKFRRGDLVEVFWTATGYNMGKTGRVYLNQVNNLVAILLEGDMGVSAFFAEDVILK
jgi:hypothetical protein